MAAAEKEQGWSNLYAAGLQIGPLLEEAPERSQAGAGSDHDERCARLVRQAEGCFCVAHKGVDAFPWLTLSKVGGADPMVVAVTGASRAVDHADGETALMRAGQRRGR